MIILTRKETDDIEAIVKEQEEAGNELISMQNENSICTMKFLEPNEARPITLEEAGKELKQTKNELASTQVALSDVYEQLVIVQEELALLKEEKNNG